MSKTVLIAEDHALINWGYQILFKVHFPEYDFDIVTTGAEFEQRIANADRLYAAALLDLQLADQNLLAVIPHIIERRPELPLLIVTNLPESVYAMQLLKLGVKGFLAKNAPERQMIEAVGTVLNGGIYMSNNIKTHLLQLGGSKHSNPFSELSIRELEVLKLMLNNKGVTDIAAQLSLATTTIASHKSRILKRLNVDNMQDLYKLAALHQLNL